MQTVISSMHNYVPMFDHKYFNVISDYFLENFKIWEEEVDQLIILDSNWDLKVDHPKIKVIKSDPNDRYYEAYKKLLPDLEGKVLFVDNDTVIYRKGIVKDTFDKLDDYDVVSIYDTCGNWKTDKINGNKFCLYYFASYVDLLKKYDCDWSPNMPEHETIGLLTKTMIDDGCKPYEIEEDKDSIYFDGTQDKGKKLGRYHIRAGSVPAYLLTTKHYGDKKTYDDYIKNQPKRETLRQLAWYWQMTGDEKIQDDIFEILDDLGVTESQWIIYAIESFGSFHGL